MTREGEWCPFNTINQAFPSILSQKLPPLIPKCKRISFLKITIDFLGFFSHLRYIGACSSLDPSSVFRSLKDGMTFGYEIMDPILQTLALSELLLCSLWFPSLAGSFRCVPQQKPQHEQCFGTGTAEVVPVHCVSTRAHRNVPFLSLPR